MKNIVFVLLFATIPTLTFAQINDDDKAKNNSIIEKVGSVYKNTLMYNSHIPFSPFGIKYSYCKSWGFYISATYDLEMVEGDAFLSAGVVKSVSEKVRCYFGSGYNPIWEEASVETGVILLAFG